MTRPTARVLALLEILQAGGTRTVSDLAVRLGVDERTVRRYAAHLIDLEVPVESVRGRYGGYRLARTYRMPPLMLTDDEAVAVLLGLVVGQRAGLLTTSAAAAESAAAKLRRVLPQPLAGRLDALVQTTAFTSDGHPLAAPETEVLLLLAEAARHRRPVALRYTAADGQRSERTVQPYGIVAHSGRWYLTGHDSGSGEIRTFRLDRITAAQALPGSFDMPTGFDPAQHVLARLASAPYQHLVSLRIHGTPEQVRPRFPAGLATLEPTNNSDGWVRVTMHAQRLDWIPALLAGIGLPFTIEQPDELRPLVDALGQELVAAASLGIGMTSSTGGSEANR